MSNQKVYQRNVYVEKNPYGSAVDNEVANKPYHIHMYRVRQRIGRFLSVKKLKLLDIMIQLLL
jgi:hypothetical protein